jgi:putative transposase
MSEQRRGNHTVTRLTVHIVWVTKYRYHVLKGEVQKRCRELIIQICDAEDVKILKGVVSKTQFKEQIRNGACFADCSASG